MAASLCSWVVLGFGNLAVFASLLCYILKKEKNLYITFYIYSL